MLPLFEGLIPDVTRRVGASLCVGVLAPDATGGRWLFQMPLDALRCAWMLPGRLVAD